MNENDLLLYPTEQIYSVGTSSSGSQLVVALKELAFPSGIGGANRKLFLRQQAQTVVRTLFEKQQAPNQDSLSIDQLLIAHEDDGKPYLQAEGHPHPLPWDISVSHSGDYLSIAISRSPYACGVDVEIIGNKAPRLLERFALKSEMGIISHHEHLHPIDLLPHALWSAKETAYKIYRPQDGNLRRFELRSISYDLPASDLPTSSSCRLVLDYSAANGRLYTLPISCIYTDRYVLTFAMADLCIDRNDREMRNI